MHWLLKKSSETLLEILITFPVRVHSYLPADRVFSRVENHLKQYETVATKEEYAKLYSNFGKENFLRKTDTYTTLKI